MKNRNIAFTTIILFALGCFALPSATQAAPAPSNVNVVNTPANPVPVRDVDNPARQPFQAEVVGGFADGASTTGDILITTVPAGKLLVIQHVSVFATMLPSQRMVSGTLLHELGHNLVHDHLRVSEQGSNVESKVNFIAVGGNYTYEGPGTSAICIAERDSTAGENPASVTFTISGYFVDCPDCAL